MNAEKNDRNKVLIAWITVIGFFAVIAFIMAEKSKVDKDVVFLFLGALITRVSQVYDYFFGSSKSSDDKTKIIAGQNTK